MNVYLIILRKVDKLELVLLNDFTHLLGFILKIIDGPLYKLFKSVD